LNIEPPASNTINEEQEELSPSTEVQGVNLAVNAADNSENDVLYCPICQESMISNTQLNRHLDDVHQDGGLSGDNNKDMIVESQSTTNSSKKSTSRPKLNLDLHDDNRGFTLSEQVGTNTKTNPPKKQIFNTEISRAHWQHPNSSNRCSYPQCCTTLSIKNGIVNCRKCGKLYCNNHTKYKCLLVNGKNGHVDYSFDSNGSWSRCCETCYFNKPDLQVGTQVKSIDIFDKFRLKRQQHMDVKQLQRNKTQSRFIRLTNKLIKQKLSSKTDIWSLINKSKLINSNANEITEYWENDDDVTNCAICYVKFNFIVRKHHCRLCGKIVCDDSLGERKNCSIIVPLSVFLEKVPNLNYSTLVHQNMKIIENDSSVLFRCCKNCKNDILHEWKISNSSVPTPGLKSIFDDFETLHILKLQIELMLPKYRLLVKSSTVNNLDKQEQYSYKMRNKLMVSLKDYENRTKNFKASYFSLANDGKLLVAEKYLSYAKLVSNMYQSFIIFLQQNLIDYKELTSEYQELEQKKLKLQQASLEEATVPRLTKKQIRELREQLMVMNEQKFLVGNLIKDYTRLRKFDELAALEENKKELDLNIRDLESQLGDFGF
jgi:hypothetical protein